MRSGRGWCTGIVIHVLEAHLPPKLLELPVELGNGPAVELVPGHKVVPGVHQVREAQQLGGVSAGNAQGRTAPFLV